MLTLGSARDLIRERSFAIATADRIGVELEWFTTPSHGPPDIPTLERLLGNVDLPHGSSLTFEPGGQVELSTVPFATIADVCNAAENDSRVVRTVLGEAGHATFAAGFDPDRTHALQTNAPRYVAMRRYFDAYGPAGGRMMCATAAIHVNVDAGDDDVGLRRWHIAHLVAPTLIAAFANSPITEAGVSGYKSSRIAAWHALDPTRTHPVESTGDPVSDWTEYALGARVMFIRLEGHYRPLDDGLTFAEWITNGHALGFPDAGDLEYHLTTLFPPIRPHGHLELRMIDMLPDPWWRAAVALTAALVCDPGAQETAEAVCHPAPEDWDLAAKCGLEHPPVLVSARECFASALEALDRIGSDDVTTAAAHEYVDRFTHRGLTPADELIAAGDHVHMEAI